MNKTPHEQCAEEIESSANNRLFASDIVDVMRIVTKHFPQPASTKRTDVNAQKQFDEMNKNLSGELTRFMATTNPESKTPLSKSASWITKYERVVVVSIEDAEATELKLNEALAEVERITNDRNGVMLANENWRTANANLVQQRDEALAQLAEATKDKERLDWLEGENNLHKNTSFLYVVDGYELEVQNDRNGTAIIFQGETLRTAIDAAMKPQQLNQGE